MENCFKKFLFSKHILVNDNNESLENNFEALFSFANMLNIKITKGEELANLSVFKFAAAMIGSYVPDPFYKGFPESVRNLTQEQLLFDQLVHYTVTYGFGDFSQPGHSLFKENFEKIAFKEKTKIKEFEILNEKDAILEVEKGVENLLASSRPLSDFQYQVVKEYITNFNYEVKECNCKDTVIKLLIDTNKVEFAKFIKVADFIRLVEHINYEKYGKTSIKKLNLKNQDRKLLAKVLDIILNDKFSIIDCYEKQADWCGILHHLHYKAKTEKGIDFVNKMRSGENNSAYSEFEKFMKVGEVKKAVDSLTKLKGPAAVMRNLNYLVSRAKNNEEIEYIFNAIKTKNNIILIQNLIQYANYKSDKARIFKFTKYNKLKMHQETEKEMVRRKSVVTKEMCDKICEQLELNLAENLKNKLGKVYIDDEMEKIALPMQENTSMGGLNVLPKGSKLDIEDTKKIRAFIYWEKVNDIDLSVIGLDDKLNQLEFSWRTMAYNQTTALTFSGDITSGYNGASEYFDIDLAEFVKLYPNLNYLVLCANVFSKVPFNTCIAKAGFMQRDIVHSGEIFEPKTVETAFGINCDSTFAYMFAIDIKNKQVIWLNVSRDSNATIAGATSLAGLNDYFNICDTINMKKFFTLLASEIVDCPEKADLIVSDKTYENLEIEQIKSYDIDKVIKLLNE